MKKFTLLITALLVTQLAVAQFKSPLKSKQKNSGKAILWDQSEIPPF